MFTPSHNRSFLVYFLIAFALLALLLHQAGYLQAAEDLAIGILQPILGITQSTRAGAENATGGLADINTLREKVAQLQSQVDGLGSNNARLKELENENNILRQQLGYRQSNPDFDLTGATVMQRNPDLSRVLGNDPSNLTRFILIDQGSAEGVKSGSPIVTPQGLVGRVTATGTHWAKVLLIIDPSSSVNAVVQTTRATGVVQGDASGNLIIKYLPQGEAAKPGDSIVTSGLGGNFPKRLVIGTVTEVRKRDIELFQEAVLQPAVDFSRLEYILVVKKFTPSDISQEPTPTPTAIPRPTRTATPKP